MRWTWEEIHGGLVFEQLVPSPPIDWTPELLARCEAIPHDHVAPARGAPGREVFADVPVWVFLEYAVVPELRGG
jgi:hypothetical protein